MVFKMKGEKRVWFAKLLPMGSEVAIPVDFIKSDIFFLDDRYVVYKSHTTSGGTSITRVFDLSCKSFIELDNFQQLYTEKRNQVLPCLNFRSNIGMI
jgi:hypothetical protein